MGVLHILPIIFGFGGFWAGLEREVSDFESFNSDDVADPRRLAESHPGWSVGGDLGGSGEGWRNFSEIFFAAVDDEEAVCVSGAAFFLASDFFGVRLKKAEKSEDFDF